MPGLLARFDRAHRAGDDHVLAVAADGDAGLTRPQPGRGAQRRSGDGAARDQFAEHRPLEIARLPRQRGGNDIAIDQRPRRGVPSEFICDERQIDRAAPADAAAAIGFVDQAHRPAEFGAAAPIIGLETGGIMAILAQARERDMRIEKPRGSVAKQVLIRSETMPHIRRFPLQSAAMFQRQPGKVKPATPKSPGHCAVPPRNGEGDQP